MDARALTLRAKRLEQAMKWRMWREGLAGLLGVLFFVFWLAMRPLGAAAVGPGLCILGTLFAVGTLLRASARAPKVDLSAPLEGSVAQYEAALRFQAKLLRDVPRWYLAPFVPGVLWIFVHMGWSKGGLAWVASGLGILLAAAVYAAIAWLNLRAAKVFTAEADSLDNGETA